MRNRRRSKAKHRCQKATKQVKGQTDGRGDKELYALNIQMFIDASVRNEFDTLKTILKFFLFKIYTWVRLLSGAVLTAVIQCGVSIYVEWDISSWSFIGPQIKRDSIQFSQSREAVFTSVVVMLNRWHQKSRSTVQSCLVCTNTQFIRSGGQKHPRNALTHENVSSSHLPNIQRFCGPGSLSVSPCFHFPLRSVWSSFIQFS